MKSNCLNDAILVSLIVVSALVSFSQSQVIPGQHRNGKVGYDSNEEAARELDSLGGGNILRELNGAKHDQRQLDQLGGGNILRDLSDLGGGNILRSAAAYKALYPSRYHPGSKRNFDEIDRAGFGRFVKRNFDEIDRAGFGRFVKRNFDEIDRAGFGRFVKRNFDEIDRAGFGRFV